VAGFKIDARVVVEYAGKVDAAADVLHSATQVVGSEGVDGAVIQSAR
jgi:hypothetical protein